MKCTACKVWTLCLKLPALQYGGIERAKNQSLSIILIKNQNTTVSATPLRNTPKVSTLYDRCFVRISYVLPEAYHLVKLLA